MPLSSDVLRLDEARRGFLGLVDIVVEERGDLTPALRAAMD